ncbi:MAG: tetratricopeptide repeat protein [Candidatus Zixiibacteriota bacterium]
MNRLQTTILAACALLTMARIVASFFPHLRLWGLSQLHYFSLEFRIGLSVIGLLILIPRVNKIVAGVLGRVFDSIAERLRKMNRYLLYSAISLAGLVPFWLLRARTPLLGDGYIRAGEIRTGKLFSVAEPLDSLLHLLFSKFFDLDAYTTYGVLSCLAGGLFVFLLLLLCDHLGRDGKEKLFIFSMVASMGANQLFFGYIESYTLMYTAMVGYVLFAVRYLRGRGGFLLPCVFMVLAAGLHLSAIFVLPTLFYLAFAVVPQSSKQKVRKSRFANAVILACVTALMGLGFYVVRADSSGGSVAHLLIYPFGGDKSYSLYSLQHLLDFFNHQFLVSPINVVLWLVTLVFLFSKVISLKGEVVRFLAGLCFCSLAFGLVIHPMLGYARDWDLFAFTGLGTTLLVLYLVVDTFRTLHQRGKSGKGREVELGRVTAILLVTALVSTLPWILVNASESRSMRRFEHLLTMEERGAERGYDIMATYLRDKDLQEGAIELWQKAIAISPNPRYYASMGNSLRRLERYDEAINAYGRSLQTAPNHPTIQLLHESLGICLAEVGRYDEAVDELEKAIDLKPGKADYHYTMSDILGRSGRYEEALSCFETALNLDRKNTGAYRTLGLAYLEIGKEEEARRCLEAYLKSEPEDADQIQEIIDSMGVNTQVSKPEGGAKEP